MACMVGAITRRWPGLSAFAAAQRGRLRDVEIEARDHALGGHVAAAPHKFAIEMLDAEKCQQRGLGRGAPPESTMGGGDLFARC